ncbi:hypothetical protein [Brevundimonas sp.]|uniref:hypothetical protein n=1 Tax=Brevundimonas sp. TaxID=1871086 RepID=UPI002EDAB277
MTLLKSLAVAGLAATLSAGAARAEDWRLLREETAFTVGLDVDSPAGPPTRRTATTVMVAKEADAPFGWLKINLFVNCEARTVTAISAFAYGRDGALMQGSDIPEEATPISEQDGTEGLRQALCDGRPPVGERYPSIDAFRASIPGS